MAESIEKITGLLEDFSPLHYQCDWDNTGWNIKGNDDVTGIYICLDVTEKTMQAAKSTGCNVILSHHPLLFRPVSCIDDSDSVGKRIRFLIENGISLFCAHTSADSAPWGINAYIADALGLENREYCEPTYQDEAGIGIVGDASFGSAPALAEKLRVALGLPDVRIGGDIGRSIKRIGICSGSCGEILDIAAKKGADTFITGEIKHNMYVDNPGMVLIEAGHYGTEKCFVSIAREYLQKKAAGLKYNVEIIGDDVSSFPYKNY